MSLVPLDVTLTTGEGEKKLARLRGRFANFKPVMEGPVRDLVQDFARRQFETAGAYGGEPWADLSPVTIAKKLREGRNNGILIRTRRLMDSLTTKNRDSVILVNPKRFRLRSRVPYGKYHNPDKQGREIFPDPMPPQFMSDLKKIITGYIVEVRL